VEEGPSASFANMFSGKICLSFLSTKKSNRYIKKNTTEFNEKSTRHGITLLFVFFCMTIDGATPGLRGGGFWQLSAGLRADRGFGDANGGRYRSGTFRY